MEHPPGFSGQPMPDPRDQWMAKSEEILEALAPVVRLCREMAAIGGEDARFGGKEAGVYSIDVIVGADSVDPFETVMREIAKEIGVSNDNISPQALANFKADLIARYRAAKGRSSLVADINREA